MKKIASILSIFLAIGALTACGGDILDPDAATGASLPEGGNTETGGGENPVDDKTLVVFFSRAGENYSVGTVSKGNTAFIAVYIAELTGADTFEIVAENPYPQGYEDTKTRAISEKENNARPAFKGKVENFDAYSAVFLGGPVWWAEPPMIIRTFLESYPSMKDKKIILFGTHEGSGITSYSTLLGKYFPDNKVVSTFGMRGSDARKDGAKAKVQDWLKGIGYLKAE